MLWLHTVGVLSLAQEPPEVALRNAVDLPRSEDRLAAARVLAERTDVDLDRWLDAVRSLERVGGPFEPGMHREEVPLEVGAAAPESTELVLYVPPALEPTTPAPLIVALHGSGGNGGQMARAWQATADAIGAVVLAPTDPGAEVGYAYTERERRAVLEALRWTQRHFAIDPDRIHLTGVSRGGHLAWDLALRHPDRFASLIPMVGGPRLSPPAKNNLRYLENVAPLSIRDLQGTQDDPLLLASLRTAFERLARWKATDALLIEFPELGHDVDWKAVDWPTFLQGAARNAGRETVVRVCARPDEGRAFWVEVLELADGVVEDFTPTVSSSWGRLSEEKRREVLGQAIQAKTARLEVTRQAPDRFQVRADGVTRLRILLAEDQLPERGELRVRWGSKTQRLTVRPDPAVLLVDFVQRLDRAFLPVAEFIVR